MKDILVGGVLLLGSMYVLVHGAISIGIPINGLTIVGVCIGAGLLTNLLLDTFYFTDK